MSYGIVQSRARLVQAMRRAGRLVLRRAGPPQLNAHAGVRPAQALRRAWLPRQGEAVAKKWRDLSPRTRQMVVASAVFEGTLKLAALIDLARRPAADVRGSKVAWAFAIVLINSVGAVPITYFLRGRRHS